MKLLQTYHLNALLALGANAAHGRGGGGKRRDAAYAVLHGGAADGFLVKAAGAPEGRINDQVESPALDEVHGIRTTLVDLVHDLYLKAGLAQRLRGAARGHQLEPQARELASALDPLGFVAVVHREKHAARGRHRLARSQLSFGEGE